MLFLGTAQENTTATYNNLKENFSRKMFDLSQSIDLREVITAK